MSRSTGPVRGFLGIAVLAILVVLVALPTLAADPSGSPDASSSAAATAAASAEPTPVATPTPTTAPTPTAEPTVTAAPRATAAPATTAVPDEPGGSPKPGKGAKPEKGPEIAVTLTGSVGSRIDADGRAEYTLTVGSRTVVLDGGPSWFYGDNHPLKAYVGKRVTITGSQRAGEDEVEVNAVNGTALRAPGKPPWAGGWKRVGARHPGWTQEKWDRWQAKAASKAKAKGVDCFPPGQCKVKPGKGAPASDDMTGADAGA